MTVLARIAYAKLNLALHVRRRRADFYHEIETLFAFCEDGDVIEVGRAGDAATVVTPGQARDGGELSLEVVGPFGGGLEGTDNLIMRAADALRGNAKLGAAIRLDKRLPVASGLGGGSADAAATLLLLRELWQLPIDDAALAMLALRLGADVPACLGSQMTRGEGIGERLTAIDPGLLAGMAVLLANAGEPLSTAAVFGLWDGVDRGPLPDGDAMTIADMGRNDLEPAACASMPQIATVLDALRATAASLVRMSGSGATCFALYDSDADRDRAARDLAARHPDWWLLQTRLRRAPPPPR